MEFLKTMSGLLIPAPKKQTEAEYAADLARGEREHQARMSVRARFRDAPEGEASTYIQWKGTSVCMDVNCPCGTRSHWDEEFLYALRCPGCGVAYAVGEVVQLLPLSEEEAADFDPVAESREPKAPT